MQQNHCITKQRTADNQLTAAKVALQCKKKQLCIEEEKSSKGKRIIANKFLRKKVSSIIFFFVNGMAAYNPKNIKLGLVGGGGVVSGSGKFVGKTGPPASNPLTPEAEVVNGLQIPLIRSKEAAKVLPTFTAALQRSADSFLAAEDLDNIQLELETLLSNVALRYRVLKSEYESLDRDERRNERRSKYMGELKPTSPAGASVSGKRRREEGNTVPRKNKTASKTLKITKTLKNSPATPNTDDSMDSYVAAPQNGLNAHAQMRDSHYMPKMAIPKNDTPNKFWLSVEPYCMPVTNEDLRLLDDLLEQYTGPLVPPMPDLGPHYSTVWANEDLKEVQQASNPNPNSQRLKQQNNAPALMVKKGENLNEECVNGPLSQRLVSALMEDPNSSELITPIVPLTVAESSNSSSENATSTNQNNFRSLSMLRNCISIENRVKKELMDIGLIEPNEFPISAEDEIQTEIKKLTAELTTIAVYNSGALKRLHNSGAQEIKRLETKRKLDAVDQEILEANKRAMQSKAKRRPLSSEEQQEIFRLTAEQKSLSDQLEKLTMNYSFCE